MLGIINRSVSYKSRELIRKLYCAYARPQHCSPAWNPTLKMIRLWKEYREGHQNSSGAWKNYHIGTNKEYVARAPRGFVPRYFSTIFSGMEFSIRYLSIPIFLPRESLCDFMCVMFFRVSCFAIIVPECDDSNGEGHLVSKSSSVRVLMTFLLYNF